MKDRIFRPRVPVPEPDPVRPRPRPWGAPAPDYKQLRWRYGESPWLHTRENFDDLAVIERALGYVTTRHLLWTAQAAREATSDEQVEALWNRGPVPRLFQIQMPSVRETFVRLLGESVVRQWLGLPGSRTVARPTHHAAIDPAAGEAPAPRALGSAAESSVKASAGHETTRAGDVATGDDMSHGNALRPGAATLTAQLAVSTSVSVPGKHTLTESLASQSVAGTSPAPAVQMQTGGSMPEGPAAPGQVAPAASRPTIGALFGSRKSVASVDRAAPEAPPVQMRAGDAAHDPAAVQAAATRGVATPASPLPHKDDIQRSFGGHDVSQIQAHTGSAATASAAAMGATAYAMGDHVVLDPDADLHTAAHEAAHVVQQRGGVQLKGGVGQVGDVYEQHADAVANAVVAGRSAEALFEQAPSGGQRGPVVQRAPAAVNAEPNAQPGMWERSFGESSTSVDKLARVQARKGVYLRQQPLPQSPSSAAPVPFNGLVYVVRRTTQPQENQRWCYVVATELGIAGFCEERYLAIDPPEPTAQLRPTTRGERLATIAEEAYGKATDENNSRLYVQALYVANRGRAGVQLDHVDLSATQRGLRGEEERHTLEVYKGAKVIAGDSIWIPSRAFIEQLKSAGAVTGGSTVLTEAWEGAKNAGNAAVEGAKYVAGFAVGLLEGAYNAVVDLFKGAIDMVEGVLEVVWNLVTGNPGRIQEMASAWVDKMKLAWGHRGEIADEFLKKWNAESGWDRGQFQGEVLGWVVMTVLLVLITMGEGAPAAVSGIATRWPQLVRLLKTVDTLGDVTAYLGTAVKAAKLPARAARVVAAKFGRAERGVVRAEHVAGDAERAATREHARKENGHRSGKHDTVTVSGLAQSPKTYPWARNPDGVVRSLEDVRRIAIEHGVEIPDDITVFATTAKWLPPDTYATYMNREFLPGRRVSWNEFLNKYDNVAVKISQDILDSDEAIVAVMAHEMHELNGLRNVFEQRETIPVEELRRMINPGFKGNLHDRAWDIADSLVAKMRAGGRR